MNPDENKPVEEPKTQTGEETPEQPGSIVETNDAPTAEEIAAWRKKAEDFDKAVELQRLSKLSKKEDKPADAPADTNTAPQLTADEIKQMIADGIKQGVQTINQPLYQENLTKAYRQFIQNNKWADKDEIISKISDGFNPDNSLTVDQLTAQLEKAALNAFPNEFSKAQEDRIRAKVLSEKEDIKAGDIAGGASGGEPKTVKVPDRELNEEEKRYLQAMGVDLSKKS